MKFLLQTINEHFEYDFVFEMKKAIEYLKWRGDDVSVCYCDIDDLLNKSLYHEELKDYCPIGSIDFVYAFIDKYVKEDGSKEIKPLNVPEQLFDFCGRKIINAELSNRINIATLIEQNFYDCDGEYAFVKSMTNIKDEINGPYKYTELLYNDIIPDGEYQISEYCTEIDSEYRCFVFENQLLGIQFYQGDFTAFPNVDKILEMIKRYSVSSPVAYTLDVAVTDDGDLIVIECHEFFSCGLYGFRDYSRMPYMFWRTFLTIKRRLLNEQN